MSGVSMFCFDVKKIHVGPRHTLTLTNLWPSALVVTKTWSIIPDSELLRLLETSFFVNLWATSGASSGSGVVCKTSRNHICSYCVQGTNNHFRSSNRLEGNLRISLRESPLRQVFWTGQRNSYVWIICDCWVTFDPGENSFVQSFSWSNCARVCILPKTSCW